MFFERRRVALASSSAVIWSATVLVVQVPSSTNLRACNTPPSRVSTCNAFADIGHYLQQEAVVEGGAFSQDSSYHHQLLLSETVKADKGF